MTIRIINKINWKETYVVFLNEKYKVIKKEIIDDYEKCYVTDAKFCYLTNNKRNTEIVILSENISILEFSYCRKTKKYKADLKIDNKIKYGKVETFFVKDEKNLFYREDCMKIINVYTPSDYDERKKYNIIIMFDSQNIFDKKKVGNYTKNNDPYGGWQVETSLEYLYNNYIVVGIDNADKYRENELTPNVNDKKIKEYLVKELGNIDGLYLDNLDDFINETLIELIKRKYNVNTDTYGICGSSCGGLASLYLGLKNINKYDFIFTFTPAIGLLNKSLLDIFFSNFNYNKANQPFVFLFQGENDDLEKTLFKGNQYIKELLVKKGYFTDKILEYFEPSAQHNEDAWRYAFNYAIDAYMKHKCNK